MNRLKAWAFEKIFLNLVAKNILEILDWLGSKLGPNGGKTVLGVVALALSIAKTIFPGQAAFIDPLYSALGLDNESAVGVAALYTIVGYAHKMVKGLQTFIEAAEAAAPKE